VEINNIPKAVKSALEYIEGETIDDKLMHLVVSDLKQSLRACLDRIYSFESKYGMSFNEFKDAWESNLIPDKYSHPVERDYMEWESLDDEHTLILSQLRNIQEEIFQK